MIQREAGFSLSAASGYSFRAKKFSPLTLIWFLNKKAYIDTVRINKIYTKFSCASNGVKIKWVSLLNVGVIIEFNVILDNSFYGNSSSFFTNKKLQTK
jgi:hypothetical protein